MRVFKYFDDLTGELLDVIPLEDAMQMVNEALESKEPLEEFVKSYTE